MIYTKQFYTLLENLQSQVRYNNVAVERQLDLHLGQEGKESSTNMDRDEKAHKMKLA